MRHPLVIGNWKLNGSYRMIDKLVSSLCRILDSIKISICTVVIAPPEIYLDFTKRIIDTNRIALGAQNVDVHLSGAFTGEISAKMLKDVGAKYVIIGHSERRLYHKESDELIAEKFAVLKEQDLIPVLCIGENEEENRLGKTKEVCAHQINMILKSYGPSAFKDTVIAYEPIWAIGNGQSATPEHTQMVHKFIRDQIAKENREIAEKVIIQYGGSVNASNASSLFDQPDIDGALVGSASLLEEDFAEIIKQAEEKKILLHKSKIS